MWCRWDLLKLLKLAFAIVRQNQGIYFTTSHHNMNAFTHPMKSWHKMLLLFILWLLESFQRGQRPKRLYIHPFITLLSDCSVLFWVEVKACRPGTTFSALWVLDYTIPLLGICDVRWTPCMHSPTWAWPLKQDVVQNSPRACVCVKRREPLVCWVLQVSHIPVAGLCRRRLAFWLSLAW